MYLYNEFIMNFQNDINTLLCPSKNNNNTIELTVHTSCYWGLRLTLCYYLYILKAIYQVDSLKCFSSNTATK